jgi:ankyrin repeat protein
LPSPSSSSEPRNSESRLISSIEALLNPALSPNSVSVPVNPLTFNGATPLHWLCSNSTITAFNSKSINYENLKALKLLLHYGADPALKSYTWTSNVFGKSSGQLAIHWAADIGNLPFVKYLGGGEVNPMGLIEVDERGEGVKHLARKGFWWDMEEWVEKSVDESDCVFIRVQKEAEGGKVFQ